MLTGVALKQFQHEAHEVLVISSTVPAWFDASDVSWHCTWNQITSRLANKDTKSLFCKNIKLAKISKKKPTRQGLSQSKVLQTDMYQSYRDINNLPPPPAPTYPGHLTSQDAYWGSNLSLVVVIGRGEFDTHRSGREVTESRSKGNPVLALCALFM